MSYFDELYDEYCRHADEGYLTMHTGERIHVSEMDTKDLRNCLKTLRENNGGGFKTPWILRIQNELNRRTKEWRMKNDE